MTTDELVTIAGKKCGRYSADHVRSLEAEVNRLQDIIDAIADKGGQIEMCGLQQIVIPREVWLEAAKARRQ